MHNRQQEENVGSAELAFMLDLETLIKGTAADPDLIDVHAVWKTTNYITDPSRLQTSSQTPDAPLGYHDGRRQNNQPQKPTLHGIERLTLRSPRNKQDVQRCNDVLLAEHACRH